MPRPAVLLGGDGALVREGDWLTSVLATSQSGVARAMLREADLIARSRADHITDNLSEAAHWVLAYLAGGARLRCRPR